MARPFTFRGRASASEYWWFQLVIFLVSVALSAWFLTPFIKALAGQAGAEEFGQIEFEQAFETHWAAMSGGIGLWWIVSLWPFFSNLSVTVRRLHDTDRSGWWCWITLVPFIGGIILLILLILPGDPHRNSFGPKSGGGGGGGQGYTQVPQVSTVPQMAAEDLRALRQSRMNQT